MTLFFYSVVTLWRWLLLNWVSRLRLNPNCARLTNKCHCFLFVCLLFDRDGQRRTIKGVESLASNSNHWAAEASLTAIRCGVVHKALVIELSTQTICHAIRGRKDDKVPQCPNQFFSTNVSATGLNQNQTPLFILKMAIHFHRKTQATRQKTRNAWKRLVCKIVLDNRSIKLSVYSPLMVIARHTNRVGVQQRNGSGCDGRPVAVCFCEVDFKAVAWAQYNDFSGQDTIGWQICFCVDEIRRLFSIFNLCLFPVRASSQRRLRPSLKQPSETLQIVLEVDGEGDTSQPPAPQLVLNHPTKHMHFHSDQHSFKIQLWQQYSWIWNLSEEKMLK